MAIRRGYLEVNKIASSSSADVFVIMVICPRYLD